MCVVNFLCVCVCVCERDCIFVELCERTCSMKNGFVGIRVSCRRLFGLSEFLNFIVQGLKLLGIFLVEDSLPFQNFSALYKV